MRIQETNRVRGVAIAVILSAVLAASFIGPHLWGPRQAIAAQEKGQPVDAALLAAGKSLFADNCAACHHTDKTEDKGGPSLIGLSETKKLPISGRAATAETIRAQCNPSVNRV